MQAVALEEWQSCYWRKEGKHILYRRGNRGVIGYGKVKSESSDSVFYYVKEIDRMKWMHYKKCTAKKAESLRKGVLWK
jgi:hypothetical protein